MARIEPPTRQELQTLLGDSLPAWDALTHHIEDKYEMDVLWSTGGKAAPYEKKYRRGGKTLPALVPWLCGYRGDFALGNPTTSQPYC